MKVLVTGARGFVGKNLVESLKCISEGKDRRERYHGLLPLTVFEYDMSSSHEDLVAYCAEADFVINLAGVNRPKDATDFMKGNRGFLAELLAVLESQGNACPVLLSSSVQATLQGRYSGSLYGQSKLEAEKLVFGYAERTGARALVYRLPNIYGKWCRPNYNSVVATFCHNISHDLPITVSDSQTELELLYIDDLVQEILEALLGNESLGEDGFCYAGPTDRVTLGEIVGLLHEFKNARSSLSVPFLENGSFSKKLYTTYLSYLDPSDFSYVLNMNKDARGSFTELLRTKDRGQISVNVSKPGIIKGQHWHHSKWEKFCVVSGEALIQLRKIGLERDGRPYPVVEYRVSGDCMEVVEMVPGYTHNIINLSEEQDLVTVMWANESFDPDRPDTFYEEV